MLIYLASPYSHPDPLVRHDRFLLACRAAGWLIRHGITVFSPIAHSHPIAMAVEMGGCFDTWQRHNRRWLEACDELAVLTVEGWQQSRGVAGEMAWAAELGKATTFLEVLDRGDRHGGVRFARGTGGPAGAVDRADLVRGLGGGEGREATER